MQVNATVYVRCYDTWNLGRITKFHPKDNYASKVNDRAHGCYFRNYDVELLDSRIIERNVEEIRIFPLYQHVNNILRNNTIDLTSDSSQNATQHATSQTDFCTQSQQSKDTHIISSSKSVQQFRALTPSQPRYAEMFLNMQQEMNTLRRRLDAVLSGPVHKQECNINEKFDWDKFDTISNFSPPCSIDGDLESIASDFKPLKEKEEAKDEVVVRIGRKGNGIREEANDEMMKRTARTARKRKRR
jgi:hypothetical protein